MGDSTKLSLILAVVVIVLAVVGWFTIDFDSPRYSPIGISATSTNLQQADLSEIRGYCDAQSSIMHGECGIIYGSCRASCIPYIGLVCRSQCINDFDACIEAAENLQAICNRIPD